MAATHTGKSDARPEPDFDADGWRRPRVLARPTARLADQPSRPHRPRLVKRPICSAIVGDGGGNHTTTSSTFADVNAAYSIAMPAVVGDLLEIEFQVQLFHSGAGNQGRFRFTVAGTVISNMPTNGLYYSIPDANSHFFRCAWFYVVQSGDISGGTVTVKPQFATNTATLSVRNDGTNGKPLFIVQNWRQ